MSDLLDGWGTDIFGSSLTLGADQSFITDKTSDTVSTNALDSMTPTQAPTTDDAYGWLKDLAKTGASYLIQKDAQKNAVVPAQVYAQTAAQAQGQQMQGPQFGGGGLLMILVVVGVAVLVLKD